MAIFEGRQFSGRCLVKDQGTYPVPPALGLPGGIASIRLGTWARAAVCAIGPTLDLRCKDLYGGRDEPFDPWTWLRVYGRDERPGCKPAPSELSFSLDGSGLGPCVRRGVGRHETPEQLAMTTSRQLFSAKTSALGGDRHLPAVQLVADRALTVQAGALVQADLCWGEG